MRMVSWEASQVLGAKNVEAASKSWGCSRAALTGAGAGSTEITQPWGTVDIVMPALYHVPGMPGQATAESEHALLCTSDASSL